MSNYEYDKDYPFAAFITNLGKYNEGALVGEWVKFPTTAEELKQVFERIGIGKPDKFGCVYEEWFITDYDCYVSGLYDKLGEYESLDELNYLASRLDEMISSEYIHFQAAMEVGDHTDSVKDIINLTENLDCYEVYPDIRDHDDLGRYCIEELGAMQVPEHLRNYIDYEAYGRDVALDEGGEFTSFGYAVADHRGFAEVYDGDRESIPEEYRVMTFSIDELSEDHILPDEHLAGANVNTPRGSFHLTELSKEQMEAAGYGVHHRSNDGRFYIMGNGVRAFAVKNEDTAVEKRESVAAQLEATKRVCNSRELKDTKSVGRKRPERGGV